MEQVAKFREIAGWTALGAAAVSIINGFVQMQALKSAYPMGMKPKLADQANAAASYFAPTVALLIAALCVAVCVYWRPSAMAKTLALVGLAVTGASALLHMIMRLIGLGGDQEGIQVFGYLLSMLTNLALLGALGIFFFVAWQRAQGAVAPAGYQQQGQLAPQQPAQQPMNQQPMNQQPMNQPSWQADQASGGAWNRAGDAATGASAAAWGTPGSQNQGWQPSASNQPSAMPQPSANQYPQQPGAWGQNPNQQ